MSLSPSECIAALTRPFESPAGIGPSRRALIEKLVGGPRVIDLLFHLPTGLIDRRMVTAIADAPSDMLVTVEVTIEAHMPGFQARPYRVRVRDESGFLTLGYFRANPQILQRMMPVGSRRVISGKIDFYGAERQMMHPDLI